MSCTTATMAFASHYSADELRQLSRDRAERWRGDPPVRLRRLSREDQYLDEGLWHIRERNRRWEAGDYDVAFLENEILERYFAPVLDTKSYAAPELSRWPAEQKADARQRARPRPGFISEAEPIITMWSTRRWLFWTVIWDDRRGGAGSRSPRAPMMSFPGGPKKSCCERSRTRTTICAEQARRPDILWCGSPVCFARGA